MDNIKKHKDIFEIAIRNKLTNATAAPSSELWDRVSTTLEQGTKAAPLLLFMRWGSAAAAIITVAIAANVWLSSNSSIEQLKERTIAEISQFETIEKQPIALKSISLQQPTPRFVETQIAIQPEEIKENQVTEKPTPDTTVDIHQQSNKKKDVEQEGPLVINGYQETDNHFHKSANAQKTEKPGVDISLMMAGINTSPSNSSIEIATTPYLLPNSADGYVCLMHAKYYTPSNVKHHAPIRFALSAAYYLDKRWSLESGLSYSYLKSDVTMSYSEQPFKQELQFIGVPLRVNYHIYQTPRFLLYTGIGTQIERNISAELNSNKIDEKHWHWSLDGLVGAQYNINRWLGLYAEPEVTYYATSTDLTTIRTDSPVNFNLRFGLRFSFGSR